MIGPPTQRARTHQRRNRNPRNRAVTVTTVEPHGNLKDYSGSLSFPTSRGHNSSAPLPANFASGFCGVQRVRADTTLVDQDRLWQLPVKDYQHDKYAQFVNFKFTDSRFIKCNNNNNNHNNNNTDNINYNCNKSKDKNNNIGNNTRTTVLQQARQQRGRARNHGIVFLLFAIAVTFLALFFPPVMGATIDSIEEETTSPASAAVTETTTVAVVKTRTGNDIGGSIDLLAALQLHNTTRQGVTQVPGLVRLKPAYYLQGEERDLQVSQINFERAASLLRRVPEFTVAASLRQEEANSGTIIAFSHGNNRYLELQSSGRKDELRLHYVSRRDGAVHVEAFPFRLADGVWHRVALSISGSQVELLVDCHPLYRRLLRPGPPDTNFTLPQLQLWVGQRNAKHFLFKGALQDVKLIPGAHGYLSQCPQLDTSCPTCGQFSILQNTVEQLMHNLNELTHRLAAAEGRISKVEECECQKSCRSNGTIHEDGSTWEEGCQQCLCVHGEIECRPTPCAPVTCKHPVIPAGKCCPVCLKECLYQDTIYDHGVAIFPKPCFECKCFDGSFTCLPIDTKARCPPLPCPPSEQITVAEECCKFCPGVDYCAKGHDCHRNASCLNLQTTYDCHCNHGFQGDGQNCHDVDECKQQGGLEGHHCNKNTRCVNVVGSYTCECLPGYQRVDGFNCAELDECATGRHLCSEHATCVNTPGSYYCICKDGYTGDGYSCKPVCNQTCQNGGECVAPSKCSCRRGYIGNSCELDLDECASDLHRCHHSSTCFNMPGWYYCRCKPGYRSDLHDTTGGTHCVDIDECNDQTLEKRHTCHPTARCVNTDGGYECACPHQDTPLNECSLNCWYEDREIENGEVFAPAGNPCRQCTCKDGVVTCRDPICDCSSPRSRRDKCCPQCDPAASCRHQELHHLVFRSGERWIYQCQTCECLYGEIDCWQMECPPVTCSNPVTEDGDCCPRCEDDPCARENHVNGTSFSSSSGHPQPCSYAGIVHESGSAWQDPHDKCTTCECKVPYCAQLVSNSACCVHRTGSYAVATITAVLAILGSSSTQSLLASLIMSLFRAIRAVRAKISLHRKQQYQRLNQQNLTQTQHRPPAASLSATSSIIPRRILELISSFIPKLRTHHHLCHHCHCHCHHQKQHQHHHHHHHHHHQLPLAQWYLQSKRQYRQENAETSRLKSVSSSHVVSLKISSLSQRHRQFVAIRLTAVAPWWRYPRITIIIIITIMIMIITITIIIIIKSHEKIMLLNVVVLVDHHIYQLLHVSSVAMTPLEQFNNYLVNVPTS